MIPSRVRTVILAATTTLATLALAATAHAGNTSNNTSNNSSTNTSSDPRSSNSSSNSSSNQSSDRGASRDYRRDERYDERDNGRFRVYRYEHYEYEQVRRNDRRGRYDDRYSRYERDDD